MNEKATIYDYVRMCRAVGECSFCPLNLSNNGTNLPCNVFIVTYPDKANEIILNWCKEHPIETRQSRFLKMFPEADIDCGFLKICPAVIDNRLSDCEKCKNTRCIDCEKEYWLAEVDENV